MLTEVLNSQDNLNQNLDNPILIDKFAKSTDKVRKNFKSNYSTTWTDPKDGAE